MDKILWESKDATLQFDFSADGTDFCDVDQNSLLFRRLQHYRQWCLTHQTEYRYLQIVSDWIDGVKHTFSRPVRLQPQSFEVVRVTLDPWEPHPHPSLQFSIATDIIDSVSDGLLVAETESIGGGSNITFVNTALAKLSGYSKETLRGLSLAEFYTGTADVEALQVLNSARNNFETKTVLLAQHRKDGSSYLARITQSALADVTGWQTHYVSTHVDVTEEENERRIKNRERHLSQRMQEMAKTGWWRLNLGSLDFEWDEGLRAIAEVDERAPKSLDLFKFVVLTDQSRIIDVIKSCSTTGRQSTTEVRIITGKQNTKWLRVHVEPEDYIDGQVHSVLGTTIDITDVVESERSRHEQHDELEFYLNCLDEYSLVMKLDADCRVMFGNERLFKSLGFTRQEIYGRPIEHFFQAENGLGESFNKAMHEGKTWRGEWVKPTGPSVPIVLDVFASPRLDAQGQLKEVFAFLYDITSRKLSDRISRLAASVRAEAADAGLLQRGLERLVSATASDCGLLQLGEVALVYPVNAIVNEHTAWRVPLKLDDLTEGALLLNGRQGGYDGELLSLIEPLIEAVIASERQRRDELLRHEQAFENRYILETLKIGSWRRNVKESQWYFSDELFALLEFPATADGVVPLEFWNQRVSQADQKALRKIARAMMEQDDNLEAIVRVNLPGQRRIHVKVQGRVRRDIEGMPEQIVGIALDVSEELKTRRELENQKSLASHQARLASIGELAAGVGHEINNPLTIIRGFLDITKNQLLSGELKEETILDLIAKMDESATRIGKIVQGLRSLSHADVIGEVSFQPESLLRSTVGFVEEIYRRHGIEINMESSVPAELKMQGYEGKLQQVVMNLLSNARDATEGQAERKIKACVYIDNAELVISVEDNGPGVAHSIRERIFDPFFTTKEIGKGTGIGLSMVFSIVQEFNGSVICQTGSLGGAEFLIRIPLSEVIELEPLAEERKHESRQSKDFAGHVLIVDDEPGVREYLMLMLGQMGLIVDTATNGREALGVYFDAPKPYDLVITDLTMPEMGGLQFLDEVRARNTTMDEPRMSKVLLSTGLPDFSFDADRYPMVIGLLSKPFNLASLRKRLILAGLGEPIGSELQKGQLSR